MRKLAFGYSTLCNIRCAHCVAAGDIPDTIKMEPVRAMEIIRDLAEAGVTGISFTAGEPFLFFDDLLDLVSLCGELKIYSRVVTNCYWAKNPESTLQRLGLLKKCGLSQLRLSYSRWHQEHVPRQNVLNIASGCKKLQIDYFISFVTDFSEQDTGAEQYLRDNDLLFFPEPVIYDGRAESFGRREIFTDYQKNCCAMNPYLAPDLTLYACCDAGSHFNTTHFFKLGNLRDSSIESLFIKSETNELYNFIRFMGITDIASFLGFSSRQIVTHRKCELCKMIFNSPDKLESLTKAAKGTLQRWTR